MFIIITSLYHTALLVGKVVHPGIVLYLDMVHHQGTCHILWKEDISRLHTRGHYDDSLTYGHEGRRKAVDQDRQVVVSHGHDIPRIILSSQTRLKVGFFSKSI